MMVSWNPVKDMPDQTGKVRSGFLAPSNLSARHSHLGQVAVVTGGNNGLGKEAVRQLALHGAKVYMASRTETRAVAAIEELEREHPELQGKSRIVFLQLDLASLESCQRAAKEVLENEERLDILSGFCLVIVIVGFLY